MTYFVNLTKGLKIGRNSVDLVQHKTEDVQNLTSKYATTLTICKTRMDTEIPWNPNSQKKQSELSEISPYL